MRNSANQQSNYDTISSTNYCTLIFLFQCIHSFVAMLYDFSHYYLFIITLTICHYQLRRMSTSLLRCPVFCRFHDDVIKWKHFPCDRPFMRGIHRSPVNSPHKGQWRGVLMFSLIHYTDVILTTMASQITSLTVVYSTVYSDADQRKHQIPRHWPLCGAFTGTSEFPAQRTSYAEYVSILCRHHAAPEQTGD